MRNVQVIVDESGLVGPLDCLSNALNIGRAYGMYVTWIHQSMGQLKHNWADGTDANFLANVTSIWFGCNSYSEAEAVSQILGSGTIPVQSGGESWGTSHQSSDAGKGSHGVSHNVNANWSLMGRRQYMADEIMRLDVRVALVKCPGLPVIKTRLLRHYDPDFWRKIGGTDQLPRRTIIKCALVLAFNALLYLLAVICLGKQKEPDVPVPHTGWEWRK